MNYRNWLRGGNCGCGCNGTPRQINNCDCDAIWAEIENLHTDDEVLQQEIDEIDLSNYYNKSEVDALIPTNLSELVNDEGFITIAALNGYATETWVQNQGYLTEHQHLKTVNNQSLIGDGNIVIEASGGSVTVDSYLDPTSTNPVQNKVVTMALNGKLDVSAYTPVDLSNYATKQWVENKNYLTEHQPLKTINGQVISGSGNIVIESSGTSITVDEDLDPTSTNPVENKAIVGALNGKLDASAYTPTDLSNYYNKQEVNNLIPTSNSALTNDMHYITSAETVNFATTANTYTKTEVNNIVNNKFWCGTLAEYNALTVKEPNVLYLIHE